MDLSSTVFSDAADKANEERLSLTFMPADIEDLPFSNSTFERISALHMLFHARDIDKAVAEMARVLHPDGRIVITTNGIDTKPFINSLIDEADRILVSSLWQRHMERFTSENAQPYLQNYFSTITHKSFTSIITLNQPETVLNYFSTMRGMWVPYPTDDAWSLVMECIRQKVENKLSHGPIKEPSLLGVFTLENPVWA